MVQATSINSIELVAMNPEVALPALYTRALTFEERLLHIGLKRSEVDSNRHVAALRKLTWWTQELQCDANDLIEWRSKEFGVSSHDVYQLIAASATDSSTPVRGIPKWIPDQRAVLARRSGRTPDLGECGDDPYLFVAWPWLTWAKELLYEQTKVYRSTVEELGGLDLIIALVFPCLRRRIKALLLRTLVLELNVARVSGKLRGLTAAARVRSFCLELASGSCGEVFLDEYAVLTRLMTVESRMWVEATTEFIGRLAMDHFTIERRLLGGKKLGLPLSLRSGAGDRHRGGRSVMVLTFEGGSIVYKPRSLRTESLFRNLVTHVIEGTELLDMRLAGDLDCGEYGWSEFVRHATCSTDETLGRFYKRYGQLLALFHCLFGTDVHSENLLAAGEYPVPIDLECLMSHWRTGDKAGMFEDAIQLTVLHTGMLPTFPTGGAQAPDFSAVAGTMQQDMLTPVPILLLTGESEDTLSFSRKRAPIHRGGRPNTPLDPESARAPSDFKDEIAIGFENTMRRLKDCGHNLLASTNMREMFASSFRVVAWPSMNYAHLIEESLHPNVLRDAMDREAVLDSLWRRPGFEELNPSIVRDERRELWLQDIPVFFSSPGTGALLNSTGEDLKSLGTSTAKENVEARFNHIEEPLIQRHIWAIRNSLAVLGNPLYSRSSDCGFRPKIDFSRPLRSSCLDIAQQAAERILSLAYRHEKGLVWLDTMDMSEKGSERRVLALMFPGLYAGLTGLYIFFHCMGRNLANSRFHEAEEKILSTLEASLEPTAKVAYSGGILNGLGGAGSLLFAFNLVLAHAQSDRLLTHTRTLIGHIENSIAGDRAFDIMGGCAGTLCNVLNHFELTGDDASLRVARQCGDCLVDSALPQPVGVAWSTLENSTPLCGFAHGTSGIAFSLFRLAHSTGDSRYSDVASRAIEYERSVFSEKDQNWPDLRDWAATRDAVVWCYGAPGVGLSRMAQIGLGFGDSAAERELEIAFEKTITSPWGTHCLCHGGFGNLEFLALAAERTGRKQWQLRAEQYLLSLLRDVQKRGFIYDGPSETLNMMLGLAGIAQSLVRFANPSSLPSILLLECRPGASDNWQ